jgi:hypothetical protein
MCSDLSGDKFLSHNHRIITIGKGSVQWPTIAKRKLKQQWSTIPPISTKRTITSDLNSLSKTYSMMLEIQVMAWDTQKCVYYIMKVENIDIRLGKGITIYWCTDTSRLFSFLIHLSVWVLPKCSDINQDCILKTWPKTKNTW